MLLNVLDIKLVQVSLEEVEDKCPTCPAAKKKSHLDFLKLSDNVSITCDDREVRAKMELLSVSDADHGQATNGFGQKI